MARREEFEKRLGGTLLERDTEFFKLKNDRNN